MTELLTEPVLEIVSHLKTGVHYLDELVERYRFSGVPTVLDSLFFLSLSLSLTMWGGLVRGWLGGYSPSLAGSRLSLFIILILKISNISLSLPSPHLYSGGILTRNPPRGGRRLQIISLDEVTSPQLAGRPRDA